MKRIFLIISLIFFFAQSQEIWKTISSSAEWNVYNYVEANSMNPMSPYSMCGETKLIGGYFVFGTSTLISTYYTIPPHYSIKITLIFWKIDSWDNETMKIVFDSEIITRQLSGLNGQQICGEMNKDVYKEEIIQFPIHMEKHNSRNLVVIMTSSLDEPAFNEAWGIQSLKIEILECPKNCVFCTDQTSSCLFWILVESYWNGQISSEGWNSNLAQPITSSECVGIQIAGGFNLQKGYSIDKLMESLIYHFQVQISFKLWTIGEWQNEQFSLMIDDKSIYSIPIVSDDFMYSKCEGQKVKITNINVNSFHKTPTIKLSMKTDNLLNNLAYWGIQSFDFFVAKCSNFCIECTGYKGSQCITCQKNWKLIDIGCISPPLECSQSRVTQIIKKQVDLINQFKIESDEIAENIIDIGSQTLFIDELISSISFQIQVKCKENLIVKSFFRSCNSCNEEQQTYSQECINQNYSLNYYAKFLQIVVYMKKLLITISQTKLQIVQVSQTEDASREFLLLKIEI